MNYNEVLFNLKKKLEQKMFLNYTARLYLFQKQRNFDSLLAAAKQKQEDAMLELENVQKELRQASTERSVDNCIVFYDQLN